MPESRQQQVSLALKTALEAITTGNGYFNNVSDVTTSYRSFLDGNEGFHITIVQGAAKKSQGPLNKWKVMQSYEIVARMFVYTEADELQTLNRGIADIEKAVLVDTQLGGLACDTFLRGNDIMYAEAQDPIAIIKVDIEVHYRHSYLDPTTDV